MPDTLTPLRALVALLAECELSLDFRPTFRRAMVDAHAAITNAPLTSAPAPREADAREPRAEFLPLGDDFPEPTPAVRDVLFTAPPPEIAAFFAEHPELVHEGSR